MINHKWKVVLLSASPRRFELLGELLDGFEVKNQNADEACALVKPSARVMDIAVKKSVLTPTDNQLIITCDTLVFRRGVYYGKPKDREDAFRMLKDLSGKTHYVYSGVCLRSAEFRRVFYDKSAVTFKNLSDEDIYRYIDEFAPYDKAGAYGIQDGVAVKNYSGSYSNIMGLPLEKLKAELTALCGE